MPCPIDEYEDMPTKRRIVVRPVLDRGRPQGAYTYIRSQFTEAQIDAAAPLTPKHIWDLSHGTNPPLDVQQQIAARIEAARRLKYPREEDNDETQEPNA